MMLPLAKVWVSPYLVVLSKCSLARTLVYMEQKLVLRQQSL